MSSRKDRDRPIPSGIRASIFVPADRKYLVACLRFENAKALRIAAEQDMKSDNLERRTNAQLVLGGRRHAERLAKSELRRQLISLRRIRKGLRHKL